MNNRRLRRGALTIAAAGVLSVAPTIGSANTIPVASADNCPDAEVTFARGTSEPPGIGRVGEAFVDSLRQQTGKNIGVYAVNYAASRLQLHGGDGANDTIAHIKSMATSCPNTKLVLGGYSQGADVIDIVAGVPLGGITFGSSLPAEYVDNIAAVAVFGNVANRSGGSLTTQSALLGSKAIDLCNPSDPICHAGPGNEWSGHTDGYVPVYTTQAASFVATKLMSSPVMQIPGSIPQAPGPQPVPGPSSQVPVPGPGSIH
ncbi:putative cutinase cut3 [Mycobacterium simulans]|uniref:Cutinase n=1 Tax=Mycobacterium simulans TaxID=627089 RepID=A0A7Z7IHF8_9MYCO|nr:cutinase family protein [Mycobacterium simulans]SOJ53536.1 putative cutinase cut3 [Mycobacterium simulans]